MRLNYEQKLSYVLDDTKEVNALIITKGSSGSIL